MFEEAEEIAKDIYIHHFDDDVNYPDVLKAITVGVQKGAEHGYYKAKVEVEDSYRESLCNSELNLASVTEQLEELEEANEWHYVKDGDLPKGEGAVLIYWKFGDVKCASVVEPYKITEDTHIIAWKEIVLPKEK